jgi:NTE family protein
MKNEPKAAASVLHRALAATSGAVGGSFGLRHVINQLLAHVPEDARTSDAVKELAGYGCATQMHVVQLLAPRLDTESHIKDVDFSPSGIEMRRAAGYAAATRALEQAPWQSETDPLEGVILHEPKMDGPWASAG